MAVPWHSAGQRSEYTTRTKEQGSRPCRFVFRSQLAATTSFLTNFTCRGSIVLVSFGSDSHICIEGHTHTTRICSSCTGSYAEKGASCHNVFSSQDCLMVRASILYMMHLSGRSSPQTIKNPTRHIGKETHCTMILPCTREMVSSSLRRQQMYTTFNCTFSNICSAARGMQIHLRCFFC